MGRLGGAWVVGVVVVVVAHVSVRSRTRVYFVKSGRRKSLVREREFFAQLEGEKGGERARVSGYKRRSTLITEHESRTMKPRE